MTAATYPYFVTFEDGGERRKVLRHCHVCLKTDEARFSPPSQGIVSANGVEHIGLNGDTACGKDATGDGWWWPS